MNVDHDPKEEEKYGWWWKDVQAKICDKWE